MSQGLMTLLKDLQLTNVGPRIFVKVTKSWIEKFRYHRKARLLILADREGNRIAATINNYLLGEFDIIHEGEWYVMEKFQVKPKPDIRKWTEHNLHIFFERETDVVIASVIHEPNMTFFQSIPSFLDYTVQLKVSMVDVIGGVIKVWRMVEEEYTVPSEIDTCRVRQQLKFRISDENDNHLDCYAFGEIAEEFVTMWMNRNFNRMVFVILKYWDIKSYEVTDGGNSKLCISAEETYSELIYDENDSTCLKKYRRENKRAPAYNRRVEDGYEQTLRELGVWNAD